MKVKDIEKNIDTGQKVLAEYYEVIKLYSDIIKDISASKLDENVFNSKSKELDIVNYYVKSIIFKEEKFIEDYKNIISKDHNNNKWIIPPSIIHNQINTITNLLSIYLNELKGKKNRDHKKIIESMIESAGCLNKLLVSYIKLVANYNLHEEIENDTIILSKKDFNKFLESITNPPEPNEELESAVREFKKKYKSK